MGRVQYIQIGVVLALCLATSACAKKARMTTVPRQAPAASSAQAAPSAPPSGGDEVPEPESADAYKKHSPPPKAPPAVTKLKDDERGVHRRPPREQPKKDLDVEVNRPRGHRPYNPATDCIPPKRARRSEVRVKVRVETRPQFELDPNDELTCRWERTGQPAIFLRLDPRTKTAWVHRGAGRRWERSTEIRLVGGMPPYGEFGLTIVSRQGSAIAHFRPRARGEYFYERNVAYPYESYYGDTRGVCWTKSEPFESPEFIE